LTRQEVALLLLVGLFLVLPAPTPCHHPFCVCLPFVLSQVHNWAADMNAWESNVPSLEFVSLVSLEEMGCLGEMGNGGTHEIIV